MNIKHFNWICVILVLIAVCGYTYERLSESDSPCGDKKSLLVLSQLISHKTISDNFYLSPHKLVISDIVELDKQDEKIVCEGEISYNDDSSKDDIGTVGYTIDQNGLVNIYGIALK